MPPSIEEIKKILEQFQLKEKQWLAVPYIIGIFLFVFSIIGLVLLSYVLF
tara:strand:+ start:659 stop:808 length:150 start_codon:yes stop_codon:yes gene_type:complete